MERAYGDAAESENRTTTKKGNDLRGEDGELELLVIRFAVMNQIYPRVWFASSFLSLPVKSRARHWPQGDCSRVLL